MLSSIPNYQGKNLAANASTIVKTGSSVLHTVTINKKGATGNTLTLYDGVDNTGVLLATIDTTANVGYLEYDIACKVGIFAVVATGTAADLTLSFA